MINMPTGGGQENHTPNLGTELYQSLSAGESKTGAFLSDPNSEQRTAFREKYSIDFDAIPEPFKFQIAANLQKTFNKPDIASAIALVYHNFTADQILATMLKFQQARSTEITDRTYINAYTKFCNLGPRGTYDNLPDYIGNYDSSEDKYTRFLDIALTQLLDHIIIISLGNYNPSFKRGLNYRNPISTHNSEEQVIRFSGYLKEYKEKNG